MSIRDQINDLDGKQLWCLPHTLLGEEIARTIYVSYEVADFVLWREPSDSREDAFAAEAKAVLDHFLEGGEITVGVSPFAKDGGCIMARVDPVEYEIFDFRCLDPYPGVRILGSYSETDTFIALTWDFREEFDGNWTRKVSECREEWRRLFGSTPPFKGDTINDYISQNVRAV